MDALLFRHKDALDYNQMLEHMVRFILRRLVWPIILSLLIVGISAPALAGSYRADTQQIRQALLTKYHHWKGTPYRYGGMSRHGIDCSGFVHVIYRQALGIDVPRSTRLLSHLHHRVSRRHLMAGDLVLFRINRHTLHAGIYIGRGQFIHASKTRGVMLSSMHNPYWRKVYRMAVRVIGARA